MPAKLPVREKICELMPTTSPRMLSSGPPELPGFTAASVWMKGTASRFGSPERFSRPRALTMPAVTVLLKPNGEPIAMTHSPTRSLRVSAILTTGRSLASTLMTATSLRVSAPITLAISSRRSLKRTVISSAFSTTCALVTMKPSAETTKPEPSPKGRNGPWRGFWPGWPGSRGVGAPRRPGGCWSGMKRRKNSKNGSSPRGRSCWVGAPAVRVLMLTTAGP